MKFFEGEDDHVMYLRRRFVLGASEWMAGGNGSEQNDKALFEYTDREWEFIWMTMLEDGAWAVPSIKDNDGKTVKANWAPEILIKFIAHELKCHIIVFDLLLNRVQFLSGNHVKSDNVVFDSPLLIYSTGSHFQSVFQTDHEHFINYARELEAENISLTATGTTNPLTAQNDTRGINYEKELYPSLSKESSIKSFSKESTCAKPKRNMPQKNKKQIEPKKEVVKKLKRNRKEVLEVSNTFSVLSDSEPSSKNNKTELDNKSDIEYIKSIKSSKRTPEEKSCSKTLEKELRGKMNLKLRKQIEEKRTRSKRIYREKMKQKI
jgi:hypothetical protein